jgi:ubiquinone/menaquinone biosynthesis C-methylase UbiE
MARRQQERSMPATKARYDGYADWYDEWNQQHIEGNTPELADLLGPGDGLCLDLGCGSGQYLDVLAATGRTVAGLDRSADQLRVASTRSANILQGDGARLPFADATFATVTTIYISTDVDDFPSVLREVSRVLRPGGAVVFYGAHPCFNGPHIEWLDDGGVRAHPTYRQAGWQPEQPWWGAYVRKRVGMRHHPLAEVVTAFLTAGLSIERFEELGQRPVPMVLGIRARKAIASEAS